MPQSDAVLLDKWRAHRDADAFAELLSRHATMVYGACLRVVKNPGVAEEIVQESFLELMKGPRGVRSIGAWLHTVATRRALDRLKAEGRRKERERAFVATLDSAAEADWDDTREFVDEAIAALPEALRVPVVLRFLEGRTHEAIAEELALPRSTVRSRIDKGIGDVRESLVKRGVITTVASLTAMLESAPADAAPPTLVAELGRRALAMRSGPNVLAVAAGAKYALAPVLLAGLVLGGAWIVSGRGDAPETPPVADGGGEPVAVAVAAVPAAPVATPSAPPPAVESEAPAAEDETQEATAAPAEEEGYAVNGWKLDLTPSEELQQALRQKVNLEFEDIHVKNVIEFLQDSFDLNIVLDGRVVKPEPSASTASSPQSPFSPGPANSPFGANPGGPPGLRRGSTPTPAERSGEAHPPTPAHRFPRTYATDGMVRQINLRDKPLDEALAVILTPLGLTYKVRGACVWVSTSSQITQDLTVALPSAPFREAEILSSISKSVNVEFEAIHISDLLGFVQKSFEIPIVADHRVIMPKQKRGEEAPPVLPTYRTDGIIDYINLKDTSKAEMLFALTRLLDLTYRVDRDGIYISTPDLVRGSF